MKTLHRALLLAPVAMLLAGAAVAQVDWLIPPPFEVQRDIHWDWNDPNDPYPKYSGPDDDLLKDGDFTQWEGLDFYEGHLGIDNRDGGEDRTGSYLGHHNNWDRQAPVKRMWVQLRIYQPDGTYYGGGYYLPEGHEQGSEYVTTLAHDDGSITVLLDWRIWPNPPWEEGWGEFSAAAGTMVWIDDLRVATACLVPEPGLVGLVGLGVLGVLARRKR